MIYLSPSLLDVLHGDALDVHFVNFYVISAYGARVGQSCELALRGCVIQVAIIDADREFAGWELETPRVAEKPPNM